MKMANATATDGSAERLANTGSPATYKIYVERIECIGGGARLDRWRVTHADVEIVAMSLEPFCDGCRALAELGVTGRVEMWHAGATFPSLRGDIERCAKLSVVESAKTGPRFGCWRPFDAQLRTEIAIADSAVSAGA